MTRIVMIAAAGVVLAALAPAPSAGACPPGLAKKNPPCIPPGQALKDHDDRRHVAEHRFGRGDRIFGDYVIIEDAHRHGLDRGDTYARIGSYVYRIDRETREVLDLIGAVTAVLD